jgi:hypothetical protein
MPTVDYFITGDQNAARSLLIDALQGEGFAVEPDATGNWTVSRGSQSMTVLLGAFAGKNQRLVYQMQFFQHDGALVARLYRPAGTGAMGGAIGVSRSNSVFQELDRAVGTRLTAAGVLQNAVRGD